MTTTEDARALDKAAMDKARADWWTPHLPRRDPNAAFDAGWTAALRTARPSPQPARELSVEEIMELMRRCDAACGDGLYDAAQAIHARVYGTEAQEGANG